MRKINWKDSDLFLFAVRCLSAAWNVRYNSIHCLANLVSGLALYYVITQSIVLCDQFKKSLNFLTFRKKSASTWSIMSSRTFVSDSK